MKWLWVALVCTACAKTNLTPVPATSRRYWVTTVERLAAGRNTHTHVRVRGRVTLVRKEPDGDLHIRLNGLVDSTAFVVAECIPKLPCRRPAKGDTVMVSGISRKDPEHGWFEVHPVEVGP